MSGKEGETQVQDMEVVYRQHAQTVFKYLMLLTHEADLAEELTQETFYQAVRSIDRFDESCKITTWLCAIAKNQYFSYMKKHVRMKADSAVDRMVAGAGITEAAMSAEQEVMQQVGQMELLKKLHVFPEPGREVLYQTHSADVSVPYRTVWQNRSAHSSGSVCSASTQTASQKNKCLRKHFPEYPP